MHFEDYFARTFQSVKEINNVKPLKTVILTGSSSQACLGDLCTTRPGATPPSSSSHSQPDFAKGDMQLSRSQIDEIVASALLQQSKDTVALRDFALGARHLPELTTACPSSLSARQQYFIRLASRLSSFNLESLIGKVPSMALTDKVGENFCWEFPGSYGHLGIVLKERISVHQVSIDHLPRELGSDTGIRQAPRKVILWGKVQGEHNVALAQLYRQRLGSYRTGHIPLKPRGLQGGSDLYVPLVEFEYKLGGSSKPHIQTSSVPPYLRTLNMDFEIVVLEILSNYGAPSTCLHRVRVHGSPVKSLAVYSHVNRQSRQ
ncbi:hypothetical protein BDZ97DRAFT_1915734 [Flammula alnicola]|nr:hypothetical protein BDZ97DRAFT_1915734 [Flammula alnicola]